MNTLQQMLDWFAGGSEYRYMSLYDCMNGDHLWIAITVLLDLAVAAGYVVIAVHWWSNQRNLTPSPARTALSNMKNIFLLCGICGYVFIPIKMFWPAWRLYDLFLLALVIMTWKYAWKAKDLKVVYNALGRSERLEQDLQESRAEAKRKSFFLNAVSHDLRTPLNGLTLQADLAQISLEANEPHAARQALEEIKSTARSAAELLERLLEIGRLDYNEDHNHLAKLDIAEFLKHTSAVLRPMAESKGLYLRVECPADLGVVTDRMKVDRILQNLITNAIKFTHLGGVTVRAEPSAAGVSIHVMDTGEGISPEHQARLFEEFYQVKNHERDSNKGFGLGLSIARRLAEQLEGSLVAESTLDQGSRFTLHLPDGPRISGAADVKGVSLALSR